MSVTPRLQIPHSSLSAEERAKRLDALHAEIRASVTCPLCEGRTNTVPGEGPVDPMVMFIGEAPGRLEDLEGRPFVGPSGRILDRMLQEIWLSRAGVFITSVVKCRPPGNREPTRKEIDCCLPFLERQLELVQPPIVVLLGKVALKAVLDETDLAGLHGQPLEADGRIYMATYHPAAAMRFPRIRERAAADFQELAALLKRR